jgi:hypothetical protein
MTQVRGSLFSYYSRGQGVELVEPAPRGGNVLPAVSAARPPSHGAGGQQLKGRTPARSPSLTTK